jgi:hypothetical protein
VRNGSYELDYYTRIGRVGVISRGPRQFAGRCCGTFVERAPTRVVGCRGESATRKNIVDDGGAHYRPAALIEIVLGTVRYDGLATTL